MVWTRVQQDALVLLPFYPDETHPVPEESTICEEENAFITITPAKPEYIMATSEQIYVESRRMI